MKEKEFHQKGRFSLYYECANIGQILLNNVAIVYPIWSPENFIAAKKSMQKASAELGNLTHFSVVREL